MGGRAPGPVKGVVILLGARPHCPRGAGSPCRNDRGRTAGIHSDEREEFEGNSAGQHTVMNIRAYSCFPRVWRPRGGKITRTGPPGNAPPPPGGTMEGVRAVVVSDTHAPRRWKSCPPRVAEHLRDADVILHAGDVCTASVLDELAGTRPSTPSSATTTVRRRRMGRPRTPGTRPDGLAVPMVHDTAPPRGRPADAPPVPPRRPVVFGHSHIPLDESADGHRLFNPGCPPTAPPAPRDHRHPRHPRRRAHRCEDRPRHVTGGIAASRPRARRV